MTARCAARRAEDDTCYLLVIDSDEPPTGGPGGIGDGWRPPVGAGCPPEARQDSRSCYVIDFWGVALVFTALFVAAGRLLAPRL